MSGEQVQIEMTAEDQGVLAVLQRQTAMLDKVENKMNRIEQASKKASQSAKSGMDQAASTAGLFATRLTGISSGIDLVMQAASVLKAEYEALNQRRQAAAGQQLQLHPAMANAVINANGLLTPQQIEQTVERVSKKTGVDQVAIANAVGTALSAAGATNEQQAFKALEAVEAAAKIGGHDPALVQTLSGAALDIGNALGASPEEAIGFMLQVGGQARITDPKKLAENLSPALANLKQFGGSEVENAALFAALNQSVKDTTGSETFSNTLKLAKELEARLPQLGSTDERIAAIRQDPKLQKAVMEGGSIGGKSFGAMPIEAKFFAPVRSLLSGEEISENFEANKAALSDLRSSKSVFEKQSENIKDLRTTRAFSADRMSSAAEQAIYTRNVDAAVQGISIDKFDKILRSTDLSLPDREVMTRNLSTNLRTGQDITASVKTKFKTPEEAYIRALEDAEYTLRNPDFGTYGALRQAFTLGMAPELQASEQNVRAADDIRGLIQSIKEGNTRVVDKLEQVRQEQQKTNSKPDVKREPAAKALSRQ